MARNPRFLVTINRLLQPSPAARYQSARELAADLGRWLGDGGLHGAAEAEAELCSVAKQAGEASIELAIRRPRGAADIQEDFSTS